MSVILSKEVIGFSDPTLLTVLTLSEVAMMWGKHRKTVELAVWRGQINARHTAGGSFLISRASVVRHWGQPLTDNIISNFEGE